MKNTVIFLVICGLIGGIVWYSTKPKPGADCEVEGYIRKIYIPEWAPVSGGEYPGSPGNPIFQELRQDRHLVFIVSVPARKLLALNKGNENAPLEEKKLPDFIVKIADGREMTPRRVTLWPRGNKYYAEEHFADKSDWFPSPGTNDNKRYNIALYFKTSKSKAAGPFEVIMDNLPPIPVDKSYYLSSHHWEE